jgi:predicted nuclease of predicted toxin-antitoxin system
MIKIIIDMNLPISLVSILENEGWEALHWSSIGDPGATDSEIMRYAKKGGYIVLTHDLDFGAILAATGWKTPSVIQIRTQDVFPESIGNMIIATIHQFLDDIKKGALISVDESRSRARILPIP